METKVFEDRIAGHEGILTNEEGIILKPLNDKELKFYQQCPSNLKPFLPAFYGTLKKANQQEMQVLSDTNNQGEHVEYLCLENIVLNYQQPNILDVKLGYKLYDKEADKAKRDRMINKSNNTTTKDLGVRVCGFQSYDYVDGKSVKSDQQKCRELTVDTVKDVFRQFIPLDIDKDTRKLILDGIINEIQYLNSELLLTEVSLRSASLLIVFESNIDRLKLLFQSEDQLPNSKEEDCYPIDVRLIDFAHSHFETGIGTDHEFTKSLSNLISLFENLY